MFMRFGNVHAPETTGKFVAATFEHDTARPVDGYAAPQLHTHAVIFNFTERDNGQTRALQPQELFASQRVATSVYRSELAMRLQGLGYELERGKHGQPEIKGYTKEYLEASSPRREQIKDHLREHGLDGAGAAQVAAHRTRDSKELLSPEQVLEKHRSIASRRLCRARTSPGRSGHGPLGTNSMMYCATHARRKSPASSAENTRESRALMPRKTC
jgi:conjugative relaxase-like TrwC/TraI family protein